MADDNKAEETAPATMGQQLKLAPAMKLTSVTVFRDGARISRRFEIDLVEAENGHLEAIVMLKGLPVACRRDSFRIRAFSKDSADAVKLVNLKTDAVRIQRKELVTETAEATAASNDSFFSTTVYLEALRNNLEELQNKYEEIESEINQMFEDKQCILRHSENYLLITPPAKTEPTEDEGLELVNPSRAVEFVTTLRPLLDNARATETLRKSRRKIIQDIQLVKEELQRVAPYVPWNTGKVESTAKELRMLAEHLQLVDVLNVSFKLQFVGQSTRSLELELVYVVGDATWKPEYTIHARSGVAAPNALSDSTVAGAQPTAGARSTKPASHKGTATAYLVGYGVITQNTGEDWSNLVDLCVSSASIDEAPIPSELPSQVVSVKPPASSVASPYHTRHEFGRGGLQKRALMARGMSTSAEGVMMADSVAMLACRATSPQFATATSEKHGFNVVYKIQGQSTIRTGKEGTRVPIVEGSFPCGLMRVCVPSQTASVFLEAKMRNNSNSPWLPTDKVSLYLDGIYVGIASSFTSNVFPGSFLSLGFGLDRSATAKHSGEQSYDTEKLMFAGKIKHRKVKASTLITVSNSNIRDGFAQVPLVVISPLPLSREAKITVTVESPSNRIEIANAGDDIEAAWQLTKHWSTSSHKMSGEATVLLAAINKSTNHVLQLVELGPNQVSATVETSYSVAWPVGKEIVSRTQTELN